MLVYFVIYQGSTYHLFLRSEPRLVTTPLTCRLEELRLALLDSFSRHLDYLFPPSFFCYTDGVALTLILG